MKRTLAVLGVLMVLASSALADPFAGTYTYGDNGRDLNVQVAGDAGAYDLTGSALLLVATTAIGGREFKFTIVGDIVSGPGGLCKFEDVGTTARNPGSREVDFYTAQVRIVKSGETTWSSPFRFAVRRSPL